MSSVAVLPNGRKVRRNIALKGLMVLMAILFVAAVGSAQSIQAPTTTVLGSLPGSTHTTAQAVSPNGTVAGKSTVCDSSGNCVLHVFRWTSNSGMVDLGGYPGQYDVQILGVNDQGTVVGSLWSGAQYLFVTNGSNSWIDTQMASDGFAASAGINKLGQVVGAHLTSNMICGPLPDGSFGCTSGVRQAFIRQPGGNPVNLPGGSGSVANVIKDDGTILGSIGNQAVVWKADANGNVTGPTLIPALSSCAAAPANCYYSATSVSSNGDVVGTYGDHSGNFVKAFLWTAGTNATTDLGAITAGVLYMSATISPDGLVAGTAVMDWNHGNGSVPFMYKPSTSQASILGFPSGDSNGGISTVDSMALGLGNVTSSTQSPWGGGTQHAAAWQSCYARDVHAAGFDTSSIFAANDSGFAVGSAGNFVPTSWGGIDLESQAVAWQFAVPGPSNSGCAFSPSAPLPTKTLTIFGGNGNGGDVAANVEYFNPSSNSWQSAFLAQYYDRFGNPKIHDWGNIPGTDHWINYRANGASDPDAGPTTNQTKWYLYRVRFNVPADAVNPKMTFSVKADNFAQIAINGVTTGGSTRVINNIAMPNVIDGQANTLNADAVFAQAVHAGLNEITLNIGDYGGLNGFNFRIDLSMQTAETIEIVPVNPDTTAPSVTVPGDITEEAGGPAGNVITYAASATDNVDPSVSLTCAPASGSTFAITTTTVTCSATDTAGNTGSASFLVTVADTIAPNVTVPGNTVAEATSAAGATVSFVDPTAHDVVGVVSLTSTPPGHTFPLGDTIVSVKALDAATNLGTGSFTVSVVDTTAPSLSVPADQVVEATSADGAVASFSASATDLVGVTSVTYSHATGTTFPIATTTVSVTASDASGNSTTGSFTIKVEDTTAPALGTVSNPIGSIWPPDHRMVAIPLSISSTDAVGVTGYKVTATSSEADNGLGDGDTANDIKITGSGTMNPQISVRSERAGNGNGRTYTITVVAIDAAGNQSAAKTTTVSVPKSQAKK